MYPIRNFSSELVSWPLWRETMPHEFIKSYLYKHLLFHTDSVPWGTIIFARWDSKGWCKWTSENKHTMCYTNWTTCIVFQAHEPPFDRFTLHVEPARALSKCILHPGKKKSRLSTLYIHNGPLKKSLHILQAHFENVLSLNIIYRVHSRQQKFTDWEMSQTAGLTLPMHQPPSRAAPGRRCVFLIDGMSIFLLGARHFCLLFRTQQSSLEAIPMHFCLGSSAIGTDISSVLWADFVLLGRTLCTRIRKKYKNVSRRIKTDASAINKWTHFHPDGTVNGRCHREVIRHTLVQSANFCSWLYIENAIFSAILMLDAPLLLLPNVTMGYCYSHSAVHIITVEPRWYVLA